MTTQLPELQENTAARWLANLVQLLGHQRRAKPAARRLDRAVEAEFSQSHHIGDAQVLRTRGGEHTEGDWEAKRRLMPVTSRRRLVGTLWTAGSGSVCVNDPSTAV